MSNPPNGVGNNKNNAVNAANFQMMQQQFAQQQQQQQRFVAQPGATAAQQQQQQRMLQMQLQQRQYHIQQIQQQQQKLQSKGKQGSVPRGAPVIPNNPLAPAPASLARPPSLQNTSSAAMANARKSSSPSAAKSKGATTSTATAAHAIAPKPSSSSSSLAHVNSSSGNLVKSAADSSTASHSQPPPPTTLKSATSSIGTLAASQSAAHNQQMTLELLSKCDWVDKTIWCSRQLLGGNANNGFLSATSNVQRIKRQRARQANQSKQKAAAATKEDGDAATSNKEKDSKDSSGGKDAKDSKDASTKDAKGIDSAAATKDSKELSTSSGKKRDAPDQAAEESLKKDIMNPRTAKKIKSELELGVQFCLTLQNTIRSILNEMGPEIAAYTPLSLIHGGHIPAKPAGTVKPNSKQPPMTSSGPAIAMASAVPSAGQPVPNVAASQVAAAPTPGLAKPPVAATSSSEAAVAQQPPPKQQQQQQRRASDANPSKKNSTATQASPGGPGGSTLRKHRKKKLPPSTEPPIPLSEFDAAGKRICSKKDHVFRVFETIRFRALKQGDFVAARVSSRDLWILARVQSDYPGFSIPANDFLLLTEAKRDAHFRDKVAVKDVEDKEGAVNMVPRNLVLPLPRTYSEAAEWCQRSKKGSRVYAMYPQTTSLYSATVVDNTTYCRGDDDIIVVEFDGDEADPTGVLPKYHIPARFVTLIPREFPAAQTNSKKRKSVTAAQASVLPSAAKDMTSPSSVKSMKSEASLQGTGLLEDALGGMVQDMGFDDLVTTDSLEDFGFDFNEE